MFPSQSVSATINGKPVKIHGFSTGEVSVKTRFLETPRTGILAQLHFLLDKHFTKWLPVWVWVIEHPEGIFLIDTGVCLDITTPGYFKVLGKFSNWVNTTLFKFKITPAQTPDVQLKQLGIAPKDVTTIILTHLHIDHVNGVKYFPATEILVNKLEWQKPSGDVPGLYPSWFAPALLDLNEKFDVFEHTKSLTSNGDLRLIHTPGHTKGHASVLLKTDQCNIIFAGDVCYYQDQLTCNLFSGANVSFGKARMSYQKILDFASRNPVVFLPSHDEDAGHRLKNLEVIKFANKGKL